MRVVKPTRWRRKKNRWEGKAGRRSLLSFFKRCFIQSRSSPNKTSAFGQRTPTARGRRNQGGGGWGMGDRWWRWEGWWWGGIKNHDRNHNKLVEVVCEGWRFGGRTNKNARNRSWVVSVAWAAKSDSFYLFAKALTPMAHSSPMAEITDTWRHHKNSSWSQRPAVTSCVQQGITSISD